MKAPRPGKLPTECESWTLPSLGGWAARKARSLTWTPQALLASVLTAFHLLFPLLTVSLFPKVSVQVLEEGI